MHAHGSDHDTHAAPSHGASAAADPDWNFWLGGMLLFVGSLGLLFLLSATHATGDNHSDGPGAAAQPAKAGGPVKPSEEQRMSEMLAALAGQGTTDESVPAQATADIKFVIKVVAESEFTFKIDSEPRSAADVAELLLKRWQSAQTPMYSAETLIYRVAGQSLVDRLSNRVVFKDGSEQSLTDWLLIQLAQHNGTPMPPINTKPAHPPPRTGKKKKAEDAQKAEQAPAPAEPPK
jgi:hypothetical protein